MTKKYPKIRFFGKSKGPTGYGKATEYIGEAFANSDLPVLFHSSNESLSPLSTHSGPCDIDFFIQTPPFSKFKSNNYRIGYFYWETSRLPKEWARDINISLDELWVPCHLTKNACRKAGFSGPIEVLFTPAKKPIDNLIVEIPAKDSPGFVLDGEAFVFYSVFQWNKRKGYRKLFRAYFEEFSAKENVILVIKTSPINHRDHGLSKINSDILSLKRFAKAKNYPLVFLSTERLTDEQIAGIHRMGDCFVLPHHGEGWGMPIHDAMMNESVVITTQYGGITEHLNSSNSMLIKSNLTEVSPMNWNPYYQAGQLWADPDVNHLRVVMREVYENLDLKKSLTKRAKRVAESMDIDAFSRNIENIFSQERFKNPKKRYRYGNKA